MTDKWQGKRIILKPSEGEPEERGVVIAHQSQPRGQVFLVKIDSKYIPENVADDGLREVPDKPEFIRLEPVVKVSAEHYPKVYEAFIALDLDAGARFNWPGNKQPDEYEVAETFKEMLEPVQQALAKLTDEEFEDFTTGDRDHVEEMIEAKPELEKADDLLSLYFDAWYA